jgi:ribosomal protein S18 acetylase RimI-like enzyme
MSVLTSAVIKIIQGNPLDDNALCDLFSVLENYKSGEMGDGTVFDEADLRNLRNKFQNHPEVMFFLIYRNRVITGGAVCFRTFSTFTTGWVLNIHDFCIIDEFRRSGLGRQLMNYILDFSKAGNFAKVTLEVRRDNLPAQQLYKERGFSSLDPEMLFWTHTLDRNING